MKKTQNKKESIQEVQQRNYENFCLLKLFTVHMGLTYDQYDDFCNFDEEYEMFDDLSKSSLESQYFEHVHTFNYVPRARYINIKVKEARQVLPEIRKMNPDFNLYWIGAA